MKTALSTLPQQGTATKAPAPPPIPAMPSSPGASTGGTAPQATTVAGQGGAAGGGSGGGRNGAGDIVTVPPVGPVIVGGPGGGIATTQPPDIPFDPNLLLLQAKPLFGMALAAVVVMFIGFPIVRAFIRRGEKKLELGAVRAQDLQPQIRQLQESIDAMAIELERISEAQRFQAKLMSERAGAQLPGERR